MIKAWKIMLTKEEEEETEKTTEIQTKHFLWTLFQLVSFAAVIRVVTQRFSPLTAA